MTTALAQPPAFDFSSMTPGEIEARRDQLIREIDAAGGIDALDVPLVMLQEMAYLTQALRKKNAGPPKAKPVKEPKAASAAASKASIDDLLNL